MVHLLSLGLLAENAMYAAYTMGGVIGRRCCLAQEEDQSLEFNLN
jgi:hypothetical protein